MTDKAILSQPQFKSESAAREWLENVRWPNGPACPHCGSISPDHYRLEGESHRVGLWKCKDCREQFTVTVGTVFERSKIKLHVWLQAIHWMCSSKKGVSSKQLERMLGVTYQTAWFMSHRIREAMMAPGGMLGGPGKIVEADETFYGRLPSAKGVRHVKAAHKLKIVALVERDGGVRSYHVADVTAATLKPILQAQISQETHLMTDAACYTAISGVGSRVTRPSITTCANTQSRARPFDGVAHTNIPSSPTSRFSNAASKTRQMLNLDKEFVALETKMKILETENQKLQAEVNPLKCEVERLKNQIQQHGATRTHKRGGSGYLDRKRAVVKC